MRIRTVTGQHDVHKLVCKERWGTMVVVTTGGYSNSLSTNHETRCRFTGNDAHRALNSCSNREAIEFIHTIFLMH